MSANGPLVLGNPSAKFSRQLVARGSILFRQTIALRLKLIDWIVDLAAAEQYDQSVGCSVDRPAGVLLTKVM